MDIVYNNGIPSTKEIKEANAIYGFIKKKNLTNFLGDKKLNKTIRALISAGKDARGKLVLFINGYDNVPEELYEIKEVKVWVKTLLMTHPYIFYFLSSDDGYNGTILACLSEDIAVLSPVSQQEGFDLWKTGTQIKRQLRFDLPIGFINQLYKVTVHYALDAGDTEESVRKIFKTLGYNL